MKRSICIMLAVIVGLCLAVAVPGSQAAETKNIILATTTSTQDSGLLDALLPQFEKQTGYFVKTIAVGSGQAMAMGARGEADVLLVHSPADEKKFMDEGNGSRRQLVMHNDFIIIGPADDPAGVKAAKTASEAFKLIAEKSALFISRGDNSGTHSKEKKIWESSGVKPDGSELVSADGPGHGPDPGSGRGEKRLYACRPGDISFPAEKSRPADSVPGRYEPSERVPCY